MNTLIQCEFCDVYVDFDEYLDHVRSCPENINSLTSSMTSFLTYSISSTDSNFFNLYQPDDPETEEDQDDINNSDNVDNDLIEDDDNDESDINNLNQYSNIRVINNGGTITAFINLNQQRLRTIFDNIQNGIEHEMGNNINFDNLEDVKVPVKNIDLVAPTVMDTELINEPVCTICQEVITTKARKTLCNHYFCCKCIEPWLNEMNKMCPNCLTDLEDLKDLKNKEINEKKEE